MTIKKIVIPIIISFFTYILVSTYRYSSLQLELVDKIYNYLKSENELSDFPRYLDFLASIDNINLSVQTQEFYLAAKSNVNKDYILQLLKYDNMSL